METKRVYLATCCDFTVLSLRPDRTLDRRQGRIGPGRNWMHGGSVVKKSCVSSGWRPSFVSSAFFFFFFFLDDLVSCDLTIGFSLSSAYCFKIEVLAA